MSEPIDNNISQDMKKDWRKLEIIKNNYEEKQKSIKNNLIISCPFCKSTNLKFQEKSSHPIHLNIHTIIFSINTIFQRKNQILKCNQCNLEIKSDKILSELDYIN